MKTLFSFLLLSALSVSPGDAALTIEGSRIIFPDNQQEATLRLLNASDLPIVVQAWIDDGAPQGTPETAGDTPVIPIPSLFRIDPARTRYLRLLATHLPQPQDRESLYWLNLVEVPAGASTPEAQTMLKVKVRIQLKLFYRPASLLKRAGSQAAAQQFSIESVSGVNRLRVTNPTPFYISYSGAEVIGEKGKAVPLAEMDIVAPFTSHSFPLPQALDEKPVQIRYALINDRGEEEIHVKSL